MQLYDLMTNKMIAPVVEGAPYFSWKLQSDRRSVMQKSYRIEVFANGIPVWDSGEVASQQQAYVPYEGKPLSKGADCRFRVTVITTDGETASAETHFSTARTEWSAKWIESTIPRVSAAEYKYGGTFPPVRFLKRFCLPAEIRKATLRATAYGMYRLTVNGIRPDDREFAPEFTAYEKLLYVQTYDVTDLLRSGENELSLLVGDGWYFSEQTGPVTTDPVPAPAVLFQLDYQTENGEMRSVCSDGSETCALGPILYSDLFQGEKQDLRKGYTDTQPVAVKEYGYEKLLAQPMPPVRPKKLLPAVNVLTTPNGETVVDFGQVLAGRARIWVDLPEGAEAIFEYFEVLDADGNYTNTMFAPQKDTVISAGKPFLHEAVFTFHGFRYVRVTGIASVRKEDFTAVLLTTDKEDGGDFACSDERLNRLYQNVRWSQQNNMLSVPTDCPSREKAGWTGDILVYAKTALQNENVTPFLTAWLKNVRADQADDGVVMITSPYEKLYHKMLLNVVRGFGDDRPTGVAGWSDAIVWVPYAMYRATGNEQILRENYGAMCRWCEYVIRTAAQKRGALPIPDAYDKWLWNTGFHFGEWLIPSEPVGGFEVCKNSAYYIAPFFGYETVRKMSVIAAVLGYTETAKRYEEIAVNMKTAIQEGMMDAGFLPDRLMGAYVLAFAFDLVPDRLKQTYADKLVSLIEANGNCLDTGFLATPFLLDVLETIGRGDLARTLLWQTQMPSWLYEVEHGATAIWEAWDADEAQRTQRYVSYDHYAFGCVDDWIMRRIGGIDTDTVGFSHLLITPLPDLHIRRCRRRLETEAGTVEVSYDEETLSVTVPCNATATVCWHGKTYEIGSGTYHFPEERDSAAVAVIHTAL